MTNARSAMAIKRTCGTVIGGVCFVSLLVSGNGFSTIDSNCVQVVDNVIQSSSAQLQKTYTVQNGMIYSLSGYNVCDNVSIGRENVLISEDKKYNLQKIDQIELLKDGWNGKRAKAFEKDLISIARSVITSLDIQPELFPTAGDSIQIEYEKEDGSYLEIQLNSQATWEVFEVDSEGQESYFSIAANIETINKVVNSFYG